MEIKANITSEPFAECTCKWAPFLLLYVNYGYYTFPLFVLLRISHPLFRPETRKNLTLPEFFTTTEGHRGVPASLYFTRNAVILQHLLGIYANKCLPIITAEAHNTENKGEAKTQH